MKRGNNKGLSTIVATLIVILLAIVAFAVVSLVVKKTVDKGAESIDYSSKCLDVDLKITKVKYLGTTVGGNYDYNVTIERTSTGEAISGVKLAFYNVGETTSKVIDNSAVITPLQTITSTNSIPFNVSKVVVTPYFNVTKGGKTTQFVCENSNTFTL